MTIITKKLITYVQAYDDCLKHTKLEELKVMKAEKIGGEPHQEAHREMIFPDMKHKSNAFDRKKKALEKKERPNPASN